MAETCQRLVTRRPFLPFARFHGKFWSPCYEICGKNSLHVMVNRHLPRSRFSVAENSHSTEAFFNHEIAYLAKMPSVLWSSACFARDATVLRHWRRIRLLCCLEVGGKDSARIVWRECDSAFFLDTQSCCANIPPAVTTAAARGSAW